VLVFWPLAIAASILLSPSAAGAQTDRQTRTVALPPGRALSVDITIGRVRIEGGPGSEAVIDITRRAPTTEALARLPIVIDEDAGDVRVRGTQADGATDPALTTDLTIKVPQDAVLRSVRLVEGRLTLAALRGAITADIRRGSIEATDLEGTVRLETGIGDITVDRARLSPNGLLRLRAFNGDVRLTLAAVPADARIMALALNGTISSEIPLRMKDTWGPRWGETTMGKGEPVISIDVITGRITIAVN
jgi:hypothetical protein